MNTKQVKQLDKDILRLHKSAVIEGYDFYIDPETGHRVMTEQYLWKRGYCCTSDCRHCPY